jgi:hypothetical protein
MSELNEGLPAEESVIPQSAEGQFEALAGGYREHYRGGLLRDLIATGSAPAVASQIASNMLSSATPEIASDKINLVRAQLSLLGDGPRQHALLALIREQLRSAFGPSAPGISARLQDFDRAAEFSSRVAVHRMRLPQEVEGNNRMFPNRPLSGWFQENRTTVQALFAALRSTGSLFLDRIGSSQSPTRVAVKLDLNLGVDGPPSVTDPAMTYAVVAELLQAARARGIMLRLMVGDSNGIENAPIGRSTLDSMRDTGHYHAALKAGLEFALDSATSDNEHDRAREALQKLTFLEQAAPPVFFGSADDRISSRRDHEAAEAVAGPWVECVDYDDAGFSPIEPALGPVAQAVWGTREFHIARPWVSTDYRVHVTRAVSNHVYSGWTGALKGLVGVHALGLRPADQGMNQIGVSPLDVLAALMRSGAFTGVLSTRGGMGDFAGLAALCDDPTCQSAIEQSISRWQELARFSVARANWAVEAARLEAELRHEQASGAPETTIMAKMRRGTRALLEEADRVAPGFRGVLWLAVAEGTRAFQMTTWKLREHIPPQMRDEPLGLRIGLLAQLPYRSDLVVQGLPKIGLGGGPDAYFEARDVGIAVAGTDEVSVDLVALREAGIPGNPWAFNHPIHGAIQFSPGPMSWDEIRVAYQDARAAI